MSTAAKEAPAAPAPFDLSSLAGVTIEPPRHASDTFSMLLYGKPKVGKTLLAGTAADVEALSPILVLAAEDGSAVLAHAYPEVDIINVPDWKTAAAVIGKVAEGVTKYKTIVIDTLSELQNLMIAHITKDGTQAMRIQDWGTIAENTANLTKLLHRSKVNSILITHADRVKDDESGKVLISPVMKGKASLGEIPKIVDIIAYYAIAQNEQKESVRVLQLEATDKVDAGDRFGKLDAQIANPTMSEIYAQLTA